MLTRSRVLRRSLWLSCLLVLPFTAASAPAPSIRVDRNEASLQFPQQIVFHLDAAGDRPLTLVELEFGVDMSGCAVPDNRAVPDGFQAATSVSTSWTWDMRQTGSLPPGSHVWWQWHLVDDAGNELRTAKQTLTWLDATNPWQSLRAGNLVLHWYTGSSEFARQLLDSGAAAAGRLRQQLGDLPPGDVDIYIYDSSEAMRSSILFEPAWSGGLAFPESRVVILGIGPSDLGWGIGAVAHELAHVVIGNLVNHCYSSMPTWLNEGLAVVAQGGPDPDSQQLFNQALASNSLMPVRALSNGFAEDSGRASLSYAEAHSLVTFLLKDYGQPKMLALLALLQAGYRYDHALQQTYGFDSDGLEVAWRQSIGAPPPARPPLPLNATPTISPTLIPLGGPPLAITATPLPSPSATPSRAGASLSTPILVGLTCCVAIVVVAGLIALFIFASRRRTAAERARADDGQG